MKMPFGKYKGQDMEDLPDSYLLWLAENIESGAVLEEAENQLKLREGVGVVRPARGSVR